MMKIQQLIADHLDIWSVADSVKKSGRGRSSNSANSVYGIKKLRELILDLAVSGKLVPQDSNDEPASELLKRIHGEKEALISAGKIKKAKPLAPIRDDEKLFELPKGWEWVRLGDVYCLEYGDNLPAEKRSNSGEYPVYGSNGVVGTHKICSVSYPCIIVGRKGSAGALNLCLSKGCCVTDVSYYCIPPKELDLVFTFKLFHTVGLDILGKGIKPGLSRSEAYNIIISIPPLTEQHRIAAKVDELMALCDLMENQHNNAAEAHERLVNQLLSMLTKSESSAEFDESWKRIAGHFDILFTTEASINALRQTILQLAVMGKLVPQDPNDEPASELLKRIQVQKEALISSRKIKKDKPLAPIRDDEKPFELPKNWGWVRLGSIGEWGAGATPLRSISAYYGGTIPWFKSGELTGEHIHSSEETITAQALNSCSLRLNQPGDILIAMYGATIGKVAILDVIGTTNQAVCACTPFNGVFNQYLLLLLKSMKSNFIQQGAGAAQPNISREKIISTAVAFPSTNMQQKIVAKVDELMALCDELNEKIAAVSIVQQRLADLAIQNI